MASMQRDHWFYVVFRCLLFSLLICRNCVVADVIKYFHISTLCVRERLHPMYKKIDGAVLTSESEDNLDCAVTFQTDSVLQKFMLRFESLALDCSDHLYIFDGAHAFGNYKLHLSCRNTRAEVGTIFTQGNFVTLKYETDPWSQPGNGFKLIITAYKDSSLGCRDFNCMNKFCISQDLTCDGVNHCSDNSDETSYAFCPDDTVVAGVMGMPSSAFVALIVCIIIVVSICLIGVGVCLCRRSEQQQLQPQQQQPGLNHPLTGGHGNFPTHPGYPMMETENLGEKPPPYPGNMYPPAVGIGYNVSREGLYYPTK